MLPSHRRLVELLVGVVPSAFLFTPLLWLLLTALLLELVPGLLHGRPPVEDGLGIVLLLMGPIGLLALGALTILIIRGPERVAQSRFLRLLVLGSGLPALIFSGAVLARQALGPAGPADRGQALWLVSLAASMVVGARYLVYLPALLRPRR
ncbi:MAG TPA: hypothetical protein VNN19_02520, partial [bacterium]|nr:hypothetical protein [bacterium]